LKIENCKLQIANCRLQIGVAFPWEGEHGHLAFQFAICNPQFSICNLWAQRPSLT